ncbi:hypothetical protein PV325_005700 [Microctonus aethiopoides]|nr:hypothetical protein PV325_005700 [Microctonus aethiopoides]
MKLIFWGLIFITVVKGFNIFSNRTFSGILGRNKRDDTTPEILKIRYQPEEHVELIVLKKVADTTLASSLVPIWNIHGYSILDQYNIEIFLVVDVASRIDITIEYQYEKAIMYVVAYWNAVDMLFRQLKRIEIKINIAGIVIGKTIDVANNIVDDARYFYIQDNSHVHIMNEGGLERLGKYFYEIDLVERDSHDFLIWMTSATLVDRNGVHEGTLDLGIAAPPAESGGMHDDESLYEIISNRAIVMHNNEYGGYQTAARELAHMMFVFNDDVEISYGGRNFNCSPSNSRIDLSSGIMDPVNKQVETDLMWSFCSEIHFENYAKFLHCVSEQGTSIVAQNLLDGTPCVENDYEGRHKRDDTTPEILKIRYQPEEHVELIVLKKVTDTTLASSMVEIWNIQDNSILDGYLLHIFLNLEHCMA